MSSSDNAKPSGTNILDEFASLPEKQSNEDDMFDFGSTVVKSN